MHIGVGCMQRKACVCIRAGPAYILLTFQSWADESIAISLSVRILRQSFLI